MQRKKQEPKLSEKFWFSDDFLHFYDSQTSLWKLQRCRLDLYHYSCWRMNPDMKHFWQSAPYGLQEIEEMQWTAATGEVNGEINPNAQTESDKTSFFYYNISDFLVFYIYIYSYIFIYMLILQLRCKFETNVGLTSEFVKKKKCFLLPRWHKCLKIFLKRPAKGQRSTQRIRRHCCVSYDSTAGKRKKITTMLHRNPVHIYLFFIFLRMNKHIKTGVCRFLFFFCSDQYPSCVRQQSCASTNSAYRELLRCLQGNHVSAESHWTSCHQASPADTWFPPRQQVPQFQFQPFFFFLFFLVCILLWLKSTGGANLYLHTSLSIRKLRKNVFWPFLGINLVLINTLLKSGGTSFQYCGWQCVSEQKS